MKRSHALALSGAALLLSFSAPSYAQVMRTGEQCVPAVANPSMYRNCRLHIVQGNEVCRCAIVPQALRRIDRQIDRDVKGTGSIGIVNSGRLDRETPMTNNRGAVADNRNGGTIGGSGTVGGSIGGGGAVGGSVGGGSIGGRGNGAAGGGVSGGGGGGVGGGSVGGAAGGGGAVGGGGSVGGGGAVDGGGSVGGGGAVDGGGTVGGGNGNGRGNNGNHGGNNGNHGGERGNNGFGNGGGDGSPNGKQDNTR